MKDDHRSYIRKFGLNGIIFQAFFFATAKVFNCDDHPSFYNNENDDDDNDNNENDDDNDDDCNDNNDNDNINDKNEDKNNENGNFHSFKIFLRLSDWPKYHGQFFITS